MVDLVNLTNRIQAFNLDHPACHDAGFGEVKHIVQMEYELGSATPRPTTIVRRLPGSLTFLAKATMTGLPNAVLFAPEVARALKARPPVLAVKRQYDADAASAPNVATEATAFIDPSTQEPVGSDKTPADQTQGRGSTKKGRE